MALSQEGDTLAARAALKTALSKKSTDAVRCLIAKALANIG